MGIQIHHKPFDPNRAWYIHAWDSSTVYPDTQGVPSAPFVSFQLPESIDLATARFMYHSTPLDDPNERWERDEFQRTLPPGASEVWTFAATARVMTNNPFPAGVSFNEGDGLTFHVVTQSTFNHGTIYAWNAYALGPEEAYFHQIARDEVNQVSTFQVTLQAWMTSGFNFKLKKSAADGEEHDLWESDYLNRTWRPGDGSTVWIKAGELNVAGTPPQRAWADIEVMYPANQPAAPELLLTDLGEASSQKFSSNLVMQYVGSPLFNIASYKIPYYPGTKYRLVAHEMEDAATMRPFPCSAPGMTSQFAAGLDGWLEGFPVFRPIALSITPRETSSFGAGLSVQPSLGTGPAYQTVSAAWQTGGHWQAVPVVPLDTETVFELLPAEGAEVKTNGSAGKRRVFTPRPTTYEFRMTEGSCEVTE